MLTGILPFKGDYEQAVIYAILNEQPVPVNKINPCVSETLEQIINKALTKNPNERYQQIDHILIDLKTQAKSPIKEDEKKKKPYQLPKPLRALMAMILLITLFTFIYVITRSDDEKVLQITHTSPLTTTPGLEQDPTWSPEGTRLAFASNESGNMDIWVRQIAAGQRVNLTDDYTGYDGQPAWSPDGEWIAFVSERDGGGIFIVSALGGIPKRVVSLPFAASLAYRGSIQTICWSPNGEELVYASAGKLFKVSADGGTPVSIPLPPQGLIVGYSEPSWSPDGKRLACTGFFGTGITTSQVWTVDHDGSDPVRVTTGKTLDRTPVWSLDGKNLIFISDRGGILDIWCMPVDERGKSTGPAQPLTVGVGVGNIALSKDGLHLAYAKITDYSNIWSIPIVEDCTITLDEATAITAENHFIELLSVSPDGKWIAFDSNRSGNQDIWIMRKDGTDLRQFTKHSSHDWAPDWSPDGKKIVFHSFRRGNRDLFIMPVAGGATTPLTDHPEQDFVPRWSPDGEEIAFFSSRSGNFDIWIIPSKGGEVRQITTHQGEDQTPIWSPDGKQIAFGSERTGNFELFIKSLDGGEVMQLTQYAWETIQPFFWSADGETIYAYGLGGPENSRVNFWAISTAEGSARPLLNIDDSSKEPNYCLTSDGERIYFPLWERIGDLWMADLSITE
jgi:Tol biopolymer transport system component